MFGNYANTVVDINYYPNIAKINVQGCIVIMPSLGELNCDRLHIILITFTYIIIHCLLPLINPCWHGPPLVLLMTAQNHEMIYVNYCAVLKQCIPEQTYLMDILYQTVSG